MATGVSKTKWNGDLHVNHCESGSVAYRPIWQNGNSDSNSDNRLNYGDNLAVMRSLLGEENVKGKIRTLYHKS